MAGFGLRHGRSQGMDGYTGNQIEFPIDPADTNLMFMGDPVALAAGYVSDAAANTPGAVAVPILGVFMGWREKASAAKLGGNDAPFAPYWSGAAGTVEPVAMVAMPPHTMFRIKGTSGNPYTQALVGQRFDYTYVAGDTRTADSRVTLGAVNAAGPLQLHRLVDLPGNDWTSDEPIMEVVVVAQQGTASDVA